MFPRSPPPCMPDIATRGNSTYRKSTRLGSVAKCRSKLSLRGRHRHPVPIMCNRHDSPTKFLRSRSYNGNAGELSSMNRDIYRT
jgi:hypothetical protein